jgi:hypothetical protein
MEIAHYALSKLEAAGGRFTGLGDLQTPYHFGWFAIFFTLLDW